MSTGTRLCKFHLIRAFAVAPALILLQACYYLQSADESIETIYYPTASAAQPAAKDLMIMLPGLGDYAETFERNGLLDVLSKPEFAVDVVAVNAHMGYYANRSLLSRLDQEVIAPALAKGYRRIHLMGISLGGYGALLYMREYPEHVSSAILLGPYLGEPDFYGYLLDVAAGRKDVVDEGNIWPWLEGLPQEDRSRIYLGYGKTDKYAESHRLLSEFLPPGNSISVSGGHAWPVWREVWPRLLDKVEALARAEESTGQY